MRSQAEKPVRRDSSSAGNTEQFYAQRSEAMQLAAEIAERTQLDPDWVQRTIGKARFQPTVARLMQPATQPFAKNWRVYRSRFIDPVRIEAGRRFWLAHRTDLARAEATYGVPAEIIVGILGVETIYGRDTGSFRVMDALSTLAFDFPPSHPRAAERSAFFKAELEAFLTLQNARGIDPFQARGSYAGAMGLPQFMPSSWQRWAVDFDGDGQVDLLNSPADAIGSVANYLKVFKWQTGMPTHYPVSFDASRLNLSALMVPDILPTFSVARFGELGAVVQGQALAHTGPLALVELLNGDPVVDGNAAQYVAGTENFYAITRYNWSSYYAMAVIELGEAVAARVR